MSMTLRLRKEITKKGGKKNVVAVGVAQLCCASSSFCDLEEPDQKGKRIKSEKDNTRGLRRSEAGTFLC
jgi:hypothetical protein